MYPPHHKPSVRPRSSLSEINYTENQNLPQSRQRIQNQTVISLACLSLFLGTLCVLLLGALVITGRNLALSSSSKSQSQTVNANEEPVLESFGSSTNIILRKDKDDSKSTSVNKMLTEVMQKSKVLRAISFRLPSEIKPKRYDLYLHPNLKTKTFSGKVTIELDVLKPISFIPVHSKYLNITTEGLWRVSKNGEDKKKIEPSLTFNHEKFEYWITEFTDVLESGEYAITYNFNGSLTDRIVGFYQSSYLDEATNETRYIATSKFEPTYARQAFPCFDEPAMKAKFKITLVRPTSNNYSALSNMNVEKETEIENDLTEVSFHESVPMSTYLSCFIVSDFAFKKQTVDSRGVGSPFEIRVYSTPQQVDKVDYALYVGRSITEYYIQYFNIGYPLPKLDMVAIPDFVSGAMENWGLVTFRESALLYDEKMSASSNKQRVATVIAHELAHSWFGNLVTMKWWNDLWLNEGFASYIEYKGVNEVHPEWKMLDQFILSDMHGVMNLDATLASHPIVQKVENPDQITELFDSITYSKGASIIRMLEDFVGPDKFKEAVTNYLTAHKYNNAVTDDLLSEIESLGFDFNVKEVMRTWTEQMGLPVIEFEKVSEGTYKIKQKRFLLNAEDYDKKFEDSPFNYRWSIPLTYFDSSSQEVKRMWFNYNDAEVVVNLGNVEWFKFNKNQVGYYRVNYPKENWAALTNALIKDVNMFSPSDRASLLNDVFNLADSTQVSYETALDLTKYLANEEEFVPWDVAKSKLAAMKKLLYYTETYQDYVEYSRNLFGSIFDKIGFNIGENHTQNLLAVSVLGGACSFGHTNALTIASQKFDEWILDTTKRPVPDLRSIIYYYGMSTVGDEQKWEVMWNVFINENDAQEKVKLMKGLAGIREPWILQKFIDLAWNEKYVRGQDYFSCLQIIAENPIGTEIVWAYVRTNWSKLVNRFGLNERYLGRMIPSITSTFSSNVKLDELNKFFNDNPEAGAGASARKQALEKVKNNIKWVSENSPQIASWLQKHK
ncbi:ENPEP.2 family protein [Megaselia abdita]